MFRPTPQAFSWTEGQEFAEYLEIYDNVSSPKKAFVQTWNGTDIVSIYRVMSK
jgi:hypothetical protein